MESGIDIQNLILQANSYMNYSHELLKKKTTITTTSEIYPDTESKSLIP